MFIRIDNLVRDLPTPLWDYVGFFIAKSGYSKWYVGKPATFLPATHWSYCISFTTPVG